MAFRAELEDFGAFYERTYPAAYRTAWAILRNSAASNDAVQDAYLAAYRERGRFRGDAPARSWLLRIVVNRVFAELRRRRPRLLEIDLEGEPAAPGDDLARATDRASAYWRRRLRFSSHWRTLRRLSRRARIARRRTRVQRSGAGSRLVPARDPGVAHGVSLTTKAAGPPAAFALLDCATNPEHLGTTPRSFRRPPQSG